MKKIILFSTLLILSLGNCQVKTNIPMVINPNAKEKLTSFKVKQKFVSKEGISQYTKLQKPELQVVLNDLLNKSADDFLNLIDDLGTEKEFQNEVGKGLARFNVYYLDLDTLDREWVCIYYEELMDAVGLESSDGKINDWMYGFNFLFE